MDVRGDTQLVRIYHRGELVKTCPTQPPGGRHTDHTDYPAEKTAYAMRDPQYMIDRARRHGPNLGAFTTRVLDGTFPWAKLRQAQKLLRLVDRYGVPALEAACRRALGFELVNVHRVEQIVLRGLDRDDTAPGPPEGRVIQGTLRFLRPSDSFVHPPTDTEES